jgi:hypothetical protein
MAKPLYIVCCESVIQDKASNLVTHFNVIEQFTISSVQHHDETVVKTMSGRPVPLSVDSVWIAEDGDLDCDFDIQLTFNFEPQEKAEDILIDTTFKFSGPRHRSTFAISPGVMFTKAGTFVVTARIKKKGTSDWISQVYPIEVQDLRTTKANASGVSEPKPKVETK